MNSITNESYNNNRGSISYKSKSRHSSFLKVGSIALLISFFSYTYIDKIQLLIGNYSEHVTNFTSPEMDRSDPAVFSFDDESVIKGDRFKVIAVKSNKGLPLRKSANSLTGKPVAYLQLGDVVVYLGEYKEKKEPVTVNGKSVKGAWLKVKNGSGNIGWVFSCALKRTNEGISLQDDTHISSLPLYEKVTIDEKIAACNGNMVGFYLYPFNVEQQGNIRLGRLAEDEKVIVIARTKRKKRMKHKNGKRLKDYYYQILFTDDNGHNGEGWIQGVWLDFNPHTTRKNRDNKQRGPTKNEVKEKSNFSEQKVIRPSIEVRSHKKVMTISVHSELPNLHGSLALNYNEIIGTVVYNVCVSETGTVLNASLLSDNTNDTAFVESIAEELKTAKFEPTKKRICREVSIKVAESR